MSNPAVETGIWGGRRGGPLPNLVIIPARKPEDNRIILGYRVQVHTVTQPGYLYFEGHLGTLISGPLHVGQNGLSFSQDDIRIVLKDGEDVRIRYTGNGEVVWSAIVEIQ